MYDVMLDVLSNFLARYNLHLTSHHQIFDQIKIVVVGVLLWTKYNEILFVYCFTDDEPIKHSKVDRQCCKILIQIFWQIRLFILRFGAKDA